MGHISQYNSASMNYESGLFIMSSLKKRSVFSRKDFSSWAKSELSTTYCRYHWQHPSIVWGLVIWVYSTFLHFYFLFVFFCRLLKVFLQSFTLLFFLHFGAFAFDTYRSKLAKWPIPDCHHVVSIYGHIKTFCSNKEPQIYTKNILH